jgi:LPS O-antigen subunit length determinant protein (WzzB/FepE family)
MKRNPVNEEAYIKFFSYFAPALTGVTFWNNNKNTKTANELLTISDEAFIHLCIINYSATWKAHKERQKRTKSIVDIPVKYSSFTCFVMIVTKKLLTNSLL